MGALQWPLRRHNIIRLRVNAAEHDALVRLGHGGDKRDIIIAWLNSEQGIDAFIKDIESLLEDVLWNYELVNP